MKWRDLIPFSGTSHLTLPDVGGHYAPPPPTLKIDGIQNFEKQPGLIRPDFS